MHAYVCVCMCLLMIFFLKNVLMVNNLLLNDCWALYYFYF